MSSDWGMVLGIPSMAANGGAAATPTYAQKILAIQSANLLIDYPSSETSGLVAVNAQGVVARNGAYVNGVVLNAGTFTDGTPYPTFDGVNDCVNSYSADLAANVDFNEGTFAIHALPDATFLASATNGYLFIEADTGVANQVRILKTTANNFAFSRSVGGVSQTMNIASPTVAWTHFALTWSVANNRIRAYINGSPVGTPGTAASISATLGSTRSAIGAANSTGALPWKGGLKYSMLWTTELTAAQILSLATIP